MWARKNSIVSQESETSGSSINTKTLGWLLYVNDKPGADDSDSLGELYNPIGSVVSPKALRTNKRMSKQLHAAASAPGKRTQKIPERVKGAIDHRLNSPYLAQPKSVQMLEEEAVAKQLEDEALGLAKPKPKVTKKKKKEKGYLMDLLGKVTDKDLVAKEREEKADVKKNNMEKGELTSSLVHEMHR